MVHHEILEDFSAIILTGGKSSRMGRSKALLPLANEPLIVHIVRTLERKFKQIIVVAAPDQALPVLPAKVVRDEVAYQGPVGGIYYGLRAATGTAAFVTSCDAAFLSLPFISFLQSKILELRRGRSLLAGSFSASAGSVPKERAAAPERATRARRAETDISLRQGADVQSQRGGNSPLRS